MGGREPGDMPVGTGQKLAGVPELCRTHMADGQLEQKGRKQQGEMQVTPSAVRAAPKKLMST